MENSGRQKNTPTKTKKRSLLRRTLKQLIITLLFLLILPLILFQFPAVQNYAAQKLTNFLSDELDTKVSVKKVWLGILYEVNLEEFYLEDQYGDTLVYAGELFVDHGGLHQLFMNKLDIESLTLRNADVQVTRAAEQDAYNFQFVIDYFSRRERDKDKLFNKNPIALDLHHVLLENVHFRKPDAVKGEILDVEVPKLEAYLDRFSLLDKKIDIRSLDINEPDVLLKLLTRSPLPPPPVTSKLAAEKELIGVDTARLVITIDEFDLSGGVFSLVNKRKEPNRLTPPEILNFNYLDVYDFEVHINDFVITEELEFSGQIENIALRDSSGFVLENLSADDATLTCEELSLLGLELRTPYTNLGDTLIFRYDSYYDWEEFVDEVRMDLHFSDEAFVSLRDITTFASALKSNVFFRENEEEVVEITGEVRGPVNRLDGRNLQIEVADGVRIEGNFSTLNLAVKDEQFLHLELDRLLTDVATLRKLIPNFTPPENFNRLGRLDFSGKFDGFFVDFVADGNLKTNIGSAEMFMNMKLRDGRENASYSGDLYLNKFDLGAWSGNPDMGKITLNSHVKEGKGLTLNTANAKLEGKIDSLRYKGYVYTNVTLNGELKKRFFDGDLLIEDENMNLTFGGEVNFTDSIPTFDFQADIEQLALKPLNLSERDLQFSGEVNMSLEGIRLSDIVGMADVSNFRVVKNSKDTLVVDSAYVTSTITDSGEKRFMVNSSLGNVDINGLFDIEKIPNKFIEYLTVNYPRIATKLNLELKDTIPDTMRFDFVVEFFELQNLFSFIEEKISGFDESRITGSYDGFNNKMSMEIEVPEWSYQNVVFNDVYFRSRLYGDEGRIQVGVVETELGKNKLSPVSLIGSVYKDTLEFLVISSNFFKILDNININGVLSLEEDNDWRISFKPSDLVILNQTWNIDTSNYIRIGEGIVETRNFIMRSDDQKITLQNVRNEGLELRLSNIPLQEVDFIRDFQKIEFGGVADLHAKVKDIFKFQGLSALLRIDDFTVNGDNYGILRLDASAASTKETIYSFLTVEGDSTALALDGYFNPPGYVPETDREWVRDDPGYFDFDVSLTHIPLNILEYFVQDLENVTGTLGTENLQLHGTPKEPEISGEATVRNVSFKIKPLQTTYRVPEGTVQITSNSLDATGNFALDRFGNKAFLEGGLTHDHLRDWGLDLRISTEPNRGFLGLETTEKDNPVFYGRAIGSGYARFSGDFRQPSLYVNGRSMEGTHMYLPLSSSAVGQETRFITFTEGEVQTGEDDNDRPVELRGLNMEFDLDITPDAEMEVIFDKAWGDVLRATGNGRLKVIITRDGRFDMYGDYVVVSGDYLFTLMNIGLNKPFIVEPGGTVSWSGDPYNATIKVSAVYDGLSTSVYNFISEYLTGLDDAESLARNSTPVDLKMNLSGALLSPDIDFDIEFPTLDSELRNYAENKLRIIRQDPNELNRQVFGLLVLGQFLPSGYTLQAGDVGLNTLSEMLSNQLSIYLTEFVSELFTGSNLIQGIDLDVSYNRFSGDVVDISNPVSYTNNELRTHIKVIVNDRWSLQVGGNWDVGGSNAIVTNDGGLLAGEFQIEYILTKDRRLKIKAYNSTEPDIAGGRRTKIGAGLSFRKEFDSLSELISFRKKKNKKNQ